MAKGLTIAGFAAAVAGAVWSLLSLLVVWSPIWAFLLSLVALTASIAGLILSIIGGKKYKAEGKTSKLATAGLIVGICGGSISSLICCACGICSIAIVGIVL